MNGNRVAVIGAGIAGLSCAAALRREGVDVAVYDKGRGPGGRASSRRTAFGRFDHGAQFFTVRNDAFARQVAAWKASGLVAPWEGRFVSIASSGEIAPLPEETRYTGTPKMNAFIAYEAEAAGAAFGVKMGPPRRSAAGDEWILRGENGQSAWAADWVVLAVPAEQAAVLLQGTGPNGSPTLAAEATHAVTAPTWTLLAAFEDEVPRPFDAAKIEGGILSFVASEASRPGREPGGRIVAHAASAWSQAHLEAGKEEVIADLTAALGDLLGRQSRPIFADAHRWRYAQVETPAPSPFGIDAEARLATCGDWRIAPRIESAWLSGHGLANDLLERL